MKLAENKIAKIRNMKLLPKEFTDVVDNKFSAFYFDDKVMLTASNKEPKIEMSYTDHNYKISTKSVGQPSFYFENNGMSFSSNNGEATFFLKLSKYLRTRLKYANGTATFQTTIPTVYNGELTYTYSVGKKFSTSSSLRIGGFSTGACITDKIEMFAQMRYQKYFLGAILSSNMNLEVVTQYKGNKLQTRLSGLYLRNSSRPGYLGSITYNFTPNTSICTIFSSFIDPGATSVKFSIPAIKTKFMVSYLEQNIKLSAVTHYDNDVKTILKLQQPFVGYPTYSVYFGIDKK